MCVKLAIHALARDWYNFWVSFPSPEWFVHPALGYHWWCQQFNLWKYTINLTFVFQVSTASLRCLTWLLRYPLPSVEKNAEDLTKMLFVLLKNYAAAGAVRSGSGNFDLVVNCFKVRESGKIVFYHVWGGGVWVWGVCVCVRRGRGRKQNGWMGEISKMLFVFYCWSSQVLLWQFRSCG